jgi:very-short-patch-repair endonuclease
MAAVGLVVRSLGPGPVRSATVLERRLRRVLREGGLPHSVSEHDLPWTRETPGRIDLAYPTGRVVIEADSRRWHTRERDFEVDRRRDREAQLAGWQVYRFTWEDLVQRPEEVVATVGRALALSSK